ncbi:MAG: hypothetical protein K2Q01_06385, partial [Rickettsiales bacterium]|nr:hypothetical protein [Rickettsiales bacterium]
EFRAYGNVFVEALASKSFMPKDGTVFHANHVPVVSLARLVLNETIPAQYENVIYLDGDLQIVGDVTPFLQYEVPEGKIAAGRGGLWMDDDVEEGRDSWNRDYLNGIGGVSPQQYFNAGVLAFRRSTWNEIAPKALAFFFEHSQLCLRHDQSALNAVCKGRVVELAPKYNFHSEYANLYAQCSYKPCIIHFTGANKPWRYSGLPWGTQFMQSYRDTLDAHPVLKPYLARPVALPLVPRLKLMARDAKNQARFPRLKWRKRQRFMDYVRGHAFPFKDAA